MKSKDKELILKSILKVTLIMIIISAILKFFGLNIFNLDLENKIINKVCDILIKFQPISFLFFGAFLYLDYFFILKLSDNNKDKWLLYFIGALDLLFLNLAGQYFLFTRIGYDFYPLYTLIIVIFISSVINKKLNVIRPFIVILIIFLYQSISLFLRNITFNDQYELMYDFLLNFDYMILMIITYYLYLMKGSDFKWKFSTNYLGQNSDGVRSSLDLKTTLSKWQKKYQLFLNSKREEKAFIIVYLLLSIIYELLNISVIIFVAFLNHTIIECLFILTSFLITKRIFGKPFHFNSATKCFIISNLTYYILNRITFSIGTSFVVPIILGVLLSYITSLFVKSKEEVKLFRGMEENKLKEICKEYNLNSLETNILVDFYSNRLSLVKLSLKYNYSKDAIWKKKKVALKKIKG